jgi:hypothetical protein
MNDKIGTRPKFDEANYRDGVHRSHVGDTTTTPGDGRGERGRLLIRRGVEVAAVLSRRFSG